MSFTVACRPYIFLQAYNIKRKESSFCIFFCDRLLRDSITFLFCVYLFISIMSMVMPFCCQRSAHADLLHRLALADPWKQKLHIFFKSLRSVAIHPILRICPLAFRADILISRKGRTSSAFSMILRPNTLFRKRPQPPNSLFQSVSQSTPIHNIMQ